MGMTIVEKIFARASGQSRVAAGDLVVVDVDCAVMLDMSFHRNQRRNILKVHDPDKIVIAYDHMVPAPDRDSAEARTPMAANSPVGSASSGSMMSVPTRASRTRSSPTAPMRCPAACWCAATRILARPVHSIVRRAESAARTCWPR